MGCACDFVVPGGEVHEAVQGGWIQRCGRILETTTITIEKGEWDGELQRAEKGKD